MRNLAIAIKGNAGAHEPAIFAGISAEFISLVSSNHIVQTALHTKYTLNSRMLFIVWMILPYSCTYCGLLHYSLGRRAPAFLGQPLRSIRGLPALRRRCPRFAPERRALAAAYCCARDLVPRVAAQARGLARIVLSDAQQETAAAH